MIHLAEIPLEGIVCYDGNHRKEVFNLCNDQELTCIVDVMFRVTQIDVYNAFNNINKSVQLPAIYIEEHSTSDTKIEIIKLVRSYETQYPQFVSTSARCHAPHFNRDTLTDNIYSIYQSFGGVISIDEISQLLDRLNYEYSQGRLCRPHSFYRPQIINKCQKYGMWLFIEKTIPIQHIRHLVDNSSMPELVPC